MMSKTTKHILVIRLSAMGDVAICVPILRAFSQQYPEVKITVLTREFFTPFFRNESNTFVFPADVKGKHKGILGLYKLSKELKVLEIDAVADLHNVIRSKILKFFFLRIKWVQLDKGRAEKKALTSKKIMKQLKTTHQRYADVFEALGFPLNLRNPTFPKTTILNNKLKLVIGGDSQKRIGIAPFAAFKGKVYPLELMESVIETLSKSHRIILFGGGKKEIEILDAIVSKYENVVNLAGKLSLSEELDVVSNLDVMLSMDSGNAHIAAMLGIKIISIWGVTHPFAGFSPFNQPEDFGLLANKDQFPLIPTSIYGNKHPENYIEASRSILPKTIVDKIEKVLKN